PPSLGSNPRSDGATDLGNRSDGDGTMAAIGTTRIEDRVWIVTGASSGIGKATATGLARLGGTVVLACRDQGRGEAAQREVVEQSKNPHGTLMPVALARTASRSSRRSSSRPNSRAASPGPA